MPMKYDALGDFQAVLREDMFAVHGFDETMILGWHCDSNLAARLALYRGRVETLIDKVFGYHCDHTRVAAANNKGRHQDERSESIHLGPPRRPICRSKPILGLARDRD